jgi:hypothetical protein
MRCHTRERPTGQRDDEEATDVAASGSNPKAIQREIEATRRELAETVDAIAQRVSPKNVANRSAYKVKLTARQQGEVLRAKSEVLLEKAGALRERAGSASADLSSRLPIGDSAVTLPADTGYAGVAAWDPARKTVRWDRVAMAGGAMTVIFVFLRRRRARSR